MAHQYALLVVAICLTTVTSVFLAARLWARFVKLRKVGLDDYMITPAYVISVAATVLTLIKCYRLGFNGHIWEIEIEDFEPATLINWWEIILYTLARAFVNISFLFLYLRVFSRSNKTLFRWTIIGSIIFIVLYTIASILAWMFQCWPVQSYWLQFRLPNPYEGSYECFSSTPLQEFIVIITVLTQMWIAILPLYVIHRVKVNARQKEVLLMLVGLGAIVVGAYIAWLYHQLRILGGNHIDSTWENYPSFIWNLVAVNVAIICACVPALNVFFVDRIKLRRIFGWFEKHKGNSQDLPEDADAKRRAQPDEMRTLNSSTSTREDSKKFKVERFGSRSQLQVPARAVILPIEVTESV